jgi:hypothetical protein
LCHTLLQITMTAQAKSGDHSIYLVNLTNFIKNELFLKMKNLQGFK